jgi:hypothetical protein
MAPDTRKFIGDRAFISLLAANRLERIDEFGISKGAST